ncbi:YciE/YciF ferroxidase family protein [Flavobacterium psychrotolerans]|nr:DUF892 family protein [Flavobacterium psychrotolerans]
MDNDKKPNENYNSITDNDTKPIRNKFDGTSGLFELLVNELKTMYYIEKALLKAFPKMIKNSCAFELIEAITIHFEETKLHVIRLGEAFSNLDEDPFLQKSETIDCLLQDVDAMIEDTKFGTVRDAGIILSLYKIGHYELATYGILSIYAELLEEKTIFNLLAESLNEEKITELRLMKIANSIRFKTYESRL